MACVADDVWEVLVKRSATRHVQHLHAAADRQGRRIGLCGLIDERKFELVALDSWRIRLGMRRLPVASWVDVGSARQDQGVDPAEE
jgi:hypothetical protein